MLINQISVFLENEKGYLAEACRLLGKNGINIRALTIADTNDFGIARLITSDPEKTSEILRKNSYAVRISPVIAVEIPDEPGGVAGILDVFADCDINIDYTYAFVEKNKNNAVVIFKVDKPEEKADILKKAGISVLTNREVLELCK